MERLIANWYIYIYDNLFTQKESFERLTMYSNAIVKTLEPGGELHTVYLAMRTIALGLLVVYFVISFGTKMQGRETSPAVLFQIFIKYFIGFAFALFAL